MRLLAALLVASLTIGACSSTTENNDPEPWQEATSYSYTLSSGCGERFLIGTFDIQVRDHVVIDASALDDDAQALLDNSGLDHIPTLQQIYDEFWTAKWGEADDTHIDHAPIDGHPLTITIDWDAGAIDDDVCYSVAEYDLVP